MQSDNSAPINPLLVQLLYNVTTEELLTINSRISGFSDEELSHFCTIYRSKRKDPQTVLLLCLLGLIFMQVFTGLLSVISAWVFFIFSLRASAGWALL